MKTLWHIARKDLWHLRWIILGWMVYQAAVIVTAVLAAARHTISGQWFALQFFLETSTVISYVVAWVLGILILREDPLTEADVFWVTRPVSGGTLCVAKLLTMLIALWLPPVLVGIPWWLYCGFGPAEMVNASAQFLFGTSQAMAMSLCFGIFITRRRQSSTLTASLTLMLILAAAYPVVRFLLGSDLGLLPYGLADSRLILCDVVVLVTVALMTVHQFITREKWKSAAIGFSGVGVILIVLHTWPGNFVASWTLSKTQPATIKGEFSTFTDQGMSGAEIAQVSGKLLLPANAMTSSCEVVEGTWKADGLSIPLKGRLQSVQKLIGGDQSLRAQLARRIVGGESAEKTEQASVFDLKACGELADGKIRAQRLPSSPVYEATFDGLISCPIWKGTIAGTLPLEEGARLWSGHTGSQLSLSQFEYVPFENTPFSCYVSEWLPALSTEGSEFVLREKATGRLIMAKSLGYKITRIHGVALGAYRLIFARSDFIPEGVYPTDAVLREWKAGWELVRVAFRATGLQRLELSLHLTSTNSATVSTK